MSFKGTNVIASTPSSSLIYDRFLSTLSTCRNLFHTFGPSLPPLRHRRKSTLSLVFGFVPIPLSPNLSPKLHFSPLKKKVSPNFYIASRSAISSATCFILSFVPFYKMMENFLSSLTITRMLTSTSNKISSSLF